MASSGHRLRSTRALTLYTGVLGLSACGAHITPLQPGNHPSPPVSAVVPTPPDATDLEYFHANALMVPVVGVAPDQVPDTFNEARDNGGRIHRATDILAPRGTPVIAAAPGKILRMSQNALGGITLYILDDDTRFLYYYAHLDHYSTLVSPGVHVVRGDILGYVGTSGNADANTPHLHFQAMRWDPNRHDYWNCPAIDVRLFFQLIGQERTN